MVGKDASEIKQLSFYFRPDCSSLPPGVQDKRGMQEYNTKNKTVKEEKYDKKWLFKNFTIKEISLVICQWSLIFCLL